MAGQSLARVIKNDLDSPDFAARRTSLTPGTPNDAGVHTLQDDVSLLRRVRLAMAFHQASGGDRIDLLLTPQGKPPP